MEIDGYVGKGAAVMAKLPVETPELVRVFGPTLHRVPAGGWVRTSEDEKLVKTHCCFCGQQCGIQLRVRNNKVVGFEPWENFPFNRGKLCPKGVKRYMQDEHPDRLKHPLQRVEGAGFEAISWDFAMRRVAGEIKRIQAAYGKDAFAVLTGASLTNEKAHLMGKFARVALQTANIDYNGRLCMVSAGAASKKVFGVDRSANPWSDILKAKVILAAGANIAECAPITTDYIWQARENVAKLIILDPRMTPIARNADLFIPVRPGGDIGVFNGMLHIMITGQGNAQGGGREQGQKCDQLPGSRDISNPEHRKYIAGVWGVTEESIPQKGLSAIPLVEAIHAGKIKGLISVCFNPVVSLPDANFVREALEKLEFFTSIDFFLSETARYADVVLAGSLMEEDEGTTTSVEGRVIRHRKAVTPPAEAREDWKIICEIASRLGHADKFSYASPKEMFEELRIASKGGVSDYYGMTWERLMGEIQRTRQGIPVNSWKFGADEVKTKVYVMVPREVTRVEIGLVQIHTTPSTLQSDPYDVALMLEGMQ